MAPTRSHFEMHKLKAYVVGVGFLGLVLSPLVRSPRVDSFPLSTYPMFSSRPDNPWIFTALGVDGDGREHRLSPVVTSGSHEIMQAAEAVRIAITDSVDKQTKLCEEIAARAGSSSALTDIGEIALVALQYDPIRYFVDDAIDPLTRYDYVRCVVRRAP